MAIQLFKVISGLRSRARIGLFQAPLPAACGENRVRQCAVAKPRHGVRHGPGAAVQLGVDLC